ncbi:MAG: DUF4157 domain-containing protein [Deltaproteobacteria bacterium]|nr:DUF4157 domain-containing protein [Kofleriaceae bacterium]
MQAKQAGDATIEHVQETAAAGVRGNGGSLPHLGVIQSAFGPHDVTRVQAHVGGDAGRAAESIGASAYATGDRVAFKDAPDLHTAAHEAAHVVQQQAGVHLAGGVGAAGDPYERHADAVADAVVRGESAVPLLAELGGGGGGARAVQRKKPEEAGDEKPAAGGAEEPEPLRLTGGEPFLVEGDAANPRIYISAAFLKKGGVKRGFTGRVNVDTHPKVVRPIVEKLATLYPWVKGRPDKPLEQIGAFGFEVDGEVWTRGEQVLGVNRNVFLTFGLPEAQPVQAFPTKDGLEIYVDTLYSFPGDKDPEKTEAARKTLARMCADLAEQLIGAEADAGRRPQFEYEIDKVLARQGDLVRHVVIDTEVLTQFFGEKAADAFANKEAVEKGAVIRVTGLGNLLILAKDEEERKKVLALLKELFGDAQEAPAGSTGATITYKDIEALFKLDEESVEMRAKLIAMIGEMRAGGKNDPGAWNAPKLRDLIANAREQIELREANQKLGKKDDEPVVGDNEGIMPYPVPGEIVNLSGEVQLGMRAEFEFRSTGTDDPREWEFGSPTFFHVSEVNVEWWALPVDAAGDALGEPDGHEVVDYIEIREDGWRNDKRFEHKFKKSGFYEIHANVVHSKFQPAHFVEKVEVVSEEERLRRMEHQTSETWGTETSRKDKVFRGVDDNRKPGDFWGVPTVPGTEEEELELDKNAHPYAQGSRAEGRLTEEVAGFPEGALWAERDRLEHEIAELEQLEERYGGDTRRDEAMRDDVRGRRKRLETALDRVMKVHEDPDAHPVQIQAHYASRTHGVKTGSLNLVAHFKKDGDVYKGVLLDHSEVVRAEHFTFKREDRDFEKMMEKLFDDLTLSYPDGSISFAFQAYDGVTPTDRFVRYTRKTDTLDKDFMEVAYDDNTRIAVTMLSLILSLFPPTAPLGIALGLVYNAVDVLNELSEADRMGTMTTAKKVDAGLLALDILPVIGSLSKTTRIGRNLYYVIEATQLAGDVYLLQDGVQHGIQDLKDRLISSLADKNAQLTELRRTNPSSPEVERLNDEIRGLESDIRGAAGKVFTDVVTNQGLQMAAQGVVRHIAGDLLSRKRGDGADGADGDDHPDADTDADDRAGTRGRHVYDQGKAGEVAMGDVTFNNALRKLPDTRAHARYSHGGDLEGILTVTADDGTRIKVDVEYVRGELDASRGHDGDAGPGSVVLTPPAPGKKRWKATVTVSTTLKRKGDVDHVVGHELDEVTELVRRHHDDPSIDLAREHEASLFKPGAAASATPTAHDVAAARELDGLFEAARSAREDYQKAVAAREDPSGAGTSIPSSVLQRHDSAVRRLQRKLEAMGFDPPGDAKSRADLVKKYAKHPDELDAFIEGYRTNPAGQLPDPAHAAKHVLHAPHAAELDKLGVDAATSQKLLDKGISGPAMIEVARHGQAAVDLLGEIAIDGRNATNAVEMVKAIAARGKIGEARKASSSLSRFSTENTPIHEVLDRLDNLPADRFDALSWMVGAPDRSRRIKLPDAEKVLTRADAKGVGDKVVALARTGKLRNPHQLAGFLDDLQTKEYGDRYSLDLAIEQAAHGDITLDAGKADVVVHRDGRPDLVMQSKYVTSKDKGAVAKNAYYAVEQLRGEHGEVPGPGDERVAIVAISDRDNPLFGKGKAEQIEGLKHNPANYKGLTTPQADGTAGWERIEVHTDGKVIVITPGDL